MRHSGRLPWNNPNGAWLQAKPRQRMLQTTRGQYASTMMSPPRTQQLHWVSWSPKAANQVIAIEMSNDYLTRLYRWMSVLTILRCHMQAAAKLVLNVATCL